MLRLTAALLLAFAATGAQADAPHVWLQTDAGPIVLKLDAQRAPATAHHIKTIVDEGFYDGVVFHRTIPGFMIQTGGFDGNLRAKPRPGTVASERSNGLLHHPGTVAIALTSTNNQPNFNSGTTEFFINTARNQQLDGVYTVFGEVVVGMSTVAAISDRPNSGGNEAFAFRPAQIQRAVTATGFPIMNLHTGAWFDPANSGRGFSVEVAHVAGAEQSGPVMIVYWYDYHEGRQVWMNGVAPFAYGASELTVPLQITDGGEWGADFDPAQVAVDGDFGTLTVRFSSCDRGVFRYETKFGSGELELQRLTIPGGNRCN